MVELSRYSGLNRRLRRLSPRDHGRYRQALRRWLVKHRQDAAAWFELGRLDEVQQPERALQAYRRALALQPQRADAWYRSGVIYQQQARLHEALWALGRCLALQPTASAQLYLRLAGLLVALGRHRQALGFYLQALEREPAQAQIFYELARLLPWMGDHALALDVLMTLGRLYPEQLDSTAFLMGYVLEKQGQTAAALQCYDEALRLRPRHLFLQLKRALVRDLIPADRPALEIASRAIEAALLQACQRLQQQPQTLTREQLVWLDMLHASVSIAAYYHTPQLGMRRALAELVVRTVPRLPAWQPRPVVGPRLRLGIVIAPRSLVLGYLCAVGMADRLDAEVFEVVLLCASAEIAQMFSAAFPFPVTGRHMRWQLIASEPVQATLEVRALDFDALFFTEPGWDFAQYLMAVYRVAPLQFTSWMSPGTTGLKQMDAFLSSTLLEPPRAEAEYSESLERWPVLPSWLPDISFPPPAPRADFGLQDDWHVYACLQNLLKLHPDFDALLGEILRRDPLGQVVMVCATEQQPLAAKLMQRFERSLADVMPRIWVFPELSNQQFMQLLQCSDVALDPLYFGGGATTYQTVLCGLPLVTWPGERMVGRISAALCRIIGVTDCIVQDAEAYVATAVAVAGDPVRRADIHRRMLAGRPRLVENPQSVAQLAAFLRRNCRQL